MSSDHRIVALEIPGVPPAPMTDEHVRLCRELLQTEARNLQRVVHHDPVLQLYVEERLRLIKEILAFLPGVG